MEHRKKTSFEKKLQEINQHIFNGQLTDIIEVTYAYKKISDWHYWNETVFWYFAGFRHDSWLDFSIVRSVTTEELKEKISFINTALKDLKSIIKINEEEKIRKGILIWSLKYTKNCLNMTLLGIDFELEKAWFAHNLTDEEVQERIDKIKKLEDQNFWGRISENQSESILVYNYVFKSFQKNRKKLTKSEQDEYENVFLKKIKKYVPKNFETFSINTRKKNYFDKKLTDRLEEKIPRKKYSELFERVLNDFLWLEFQVIHEERSSIYDGPGYLSIPIDSNYDFLSKKRVIELIWHEIEVHCFNYRINQFLLGNFRWAWNLVKEEGLAMTIEEFLKWARLQEITITHHFVRVFASEIFSTKDLQRFLTLYWKLRWEEYTTLRILRQKRNYPLNFKWGQHKDATYGRGIQKVLTFLQKWGDMRELYLGKVSIDDIPKIKKILELQKKDIAELNIPIFLGELILYIFVHKNKNIDCDSFLNYLKDKYYFINFDNLDLLIVKEFVKIRAAFSEKNLKI